MTQLSITRKQLEILTLIYRFRFLNRHHIQTLLNHIDPKRINTWLKDLTNKNTLGRIYSSKLKENTKPAIYYLATKSRKILLKEEFTNEKILKRAYRDKNASQRLIKHSLFLADFYLLLRTEALKTTKSSISSPRPISRSLLPALQPTGRLYFLTNQDYTKRYFGSN